MSAIAILVTEAGEYLLQRRDERPDIWFPGFVGLFGGSLEDGEEPEEGLRREIHEELGYRIREARFFTQIAFDLRRWDHGVKLVYAYEVPVTRADISTMVLYEGAGMELYGADRVMAADRLTPYDAFVISLHLSQQIVALSPK